MEATFAISPLVVISIAWLRIFSETALVAASMPRFSNIGLAPAARFFMPSVTIEWAKTVEVVVPSPAISLVLVAASFKSWAPIFSKGSSSSISFATVTPSWVIVGEPNLRSTATLRPFGPRVVTTANAKVSMPCCNLRRASSENTSCFAVIDQYSFFGLFVFDNC